MKIIKTEEQKANTIKTFLAPENRPLMFIRDKSNVIQITQETDNKSISFLLSDVSDVLKRFDAHHEEFLQINFKTGKKMLLTAKFIGFAPAACNGLDINKLPKVVTTYDLLSVIEALESSLYDKDSYQEQLCEVKLFFEAIACGAESIGFNLTGERLWVEKLISNGPIVINKYVV